MGRRLHADAKQLFKPNMAIPIVSYWRYGCGQRRCAAAAMAGMRMRGLRRPAGGACQHIFGTIRCDACARGASAGRNGVVTEGNQTQCNIVTTQSEPLLVSLGPAGVQLGMKVRNQLFVPLHNQMVISHESRVTSLTTHNESRESHRPIGRVLFFLRFCRCDGSWSCAKGRALRDVSAPHVPCTETSFQFTSCSSRAGRGSAVDDDGGCARAQQHMALL